MLIRKRFAAGERGGVTAPLFSYLAPFQKGQGPVPGSSRSSGGSPNLARRLLSGNDPLQDSH